MIFSVLNIGNIELPVLDIFFLILKFVRLFPCDVMIFELSQVGQRLFESCKIEKPFFVGSHDGDL
jgi:hypothetical protein